jgi:hypothetical protein
MKFGTGEFSNMAEFRKQYRTLHEDLHVRISARISIITL